MTAIGSETNTNTLSTSLSDILKTSLQSINSLTAMAETKEESVKPEAPGIGMRLAIAGIAAQFPSVKCITTDKFAEIMTGASIQSDVIILDTRPEEEYKVSHIPGAIRVDYEVDAGQILESVPQLKTPDQVDQVVCYCSIGYRSSVVAEKLDKIFSKAVTPGSVRPTVVNLEGSLFKWANERRPLVDADNQPTIYAHPYNAVFGKLLDEDLRRYGKLL